MSARISVGDLLKAAAAQTGRDFQDLAFLEPLEVFAQSIDAEANLGEPGLQGAIADIGRLLVNRLLIEAAIEAEPRVLSEDVSDPIVITGLPRTGSTKALKVLAASGRYQFLPLWQALFPLPIAPPGTEPDPRITITDEQSALMFTAFPELMAAHPMSTREPEEEVLLMQLSFRLDANAWFYRAPSYLRWVSGQDQTDCYTDLRRTLQVVQLQAGGRQGRPWVLKSPAHLGTLDLVMKVFPRATVVHCHRDPQEAVPSLARLLELMQLSRGATEVDNHELGAFLLRHCTDLWSANIAARADIDPTRIVDVSYGAVCDDIADVIEAIHRDRAQGGLAHLRETALKWEVENPQHRFGRHEYSLERYGLVPADVDDAFAPYLARFGSLVQGTR